MAQEILDQLGEEEGATLGIPEHINEGNLYLKIFSHPKDTLKYILHYCPGKWVIPLFLVLWRIAWVE